MSIFRAKLVVAAIYLWLLVGALMLAALFMGLFAVGWGELNIYPGVLQMTDRHQHLGQREALCGFLMACPAAALALTAPLAMSLLFSAWMSSPLNAVAASVAVYLVLYVTGEVHFSRELRPYLFTSHIGFWRGLFREEIDWSAMIRDAAKLLSFTFGFLALACHRFRVREWPGAGSE